MNLLHMLNLLHILTHTAYLEITTQRPTNTPIPMGIHLSFSYLHSGSCSELNSVPQSHVGLEAQNVTLFGKQGLGRAN